MRGCGPLSTPGFGDAELQRVDDFFQKTLDMCHGLLYNGITLRENSVRAPTQKAEREQAIEDMRTGAKRYLFATYALAKEGLDVPRMDRLYLATPQKDYAVITQSIGRIERKFDGKDDPVVYDYVDASRFHLKAYKTRCTTYRKCGCKFKED